MTGELKTGGKMHKRTSIFLAAILSAAFFGASCTGAQAGAPKAQPNQTAQQPGKPVAKATTDENKKAIIYQILLPIFTHEGTLDRARQMLPHIKSTGSNIVYLCPVVEIDDGTDRAFWSKRQKASNLNNPKNPYRLKDYFKIEPDYGTDADLKNFVDDAHKLGMRVILDLVYYHCGPNATLIKKDKNMVVLDKDGNVKKGAWSFPELNFKNPKLREYLYENMEYFIKKFDVDGYRIDAEAHLPTDFMGEAAKRVRKIKPGVMMLAESARDSAQISVYDAQYGFKWHQALMRVFLGQTPATDARQAWENHSNKYPTGARLLRDLDNHDTASDGCYKHGKRYEKLFTNKGMDAVMVINYTMDGIPMIFCGNEFADDTYLSMFSSPKHGRLEIGWENLNTEQGKRRMALLKKLSSLRMGNEALWNGQTKWLDTSAPESVIAFMRTCGKQNIAVFVNAKNAKVSFETSLDTQGAKTMLSSGAAIESKDGKTFAKLEPFGYAIVQLK